MARLLAAVIAAIAWTSGYACAQPRLNGPLFPALPDEMIAAMSDALRGCDAKFRQLTKQAPISDVTKVCVAPPIPVAQRRVIIEAGRVTGLLEACGEVAPSREVLPKAMVGVEALPNYGADVEYYGSALHGFARGFFREAFAANNMCRDPGVRAHYLALAREHLDTYVLPRPMAEGAN